MKRMSAKEFWEVLYTHCQMKREVWGYEGILNKITQSFWRDAEISRKYGNVKCAEISEKKASSLFDYLDSKGYYDNSL